MVTDWNEFSGLNEAYLLDLFDRYQADPASVLLAYVSLSDQRGGGVETSFKGDRQGLGNTKRGKKRGSRPANGHLAGQLGPQCGDLGSKLSDGGCPSIQTAALWDGAHGARCLPCQWFSRH